MEAGVREGGVVSKLAVAYRVHIFRTESYMHTLILRVQLALEIYQRRKGGGWHDAFIKFLGLLDLCIGLKQKGKRNPKKPNTKHVPKP